MKLGYISDLHIDHNEAYPVLNSLIRLAKENKIDALLIGGDISNTYTLSFAIIEKLKERIGIPVYFVLGNHDYYSQDGAQKIREEYLEKYSLGIDLGNNWALIGDTGWYDYKWMSTYGIGYSMYRKGKYAYGGGTWPDHRFIKSTTDQKFDDFLLRDSEKNITEQYNKFKDKKLIVMTHMVPHESLLFDRSDFLPTNAFFGGASLQKLISSIEPCYALFGHTHFDWDKIIGDTRYICAPVGYSGFEWGISTVDEVLEQRLKIIELGE